jgi:signal transduction histidine kinase
VLRKPERKRPGRASGRAPARQPAWYAERARLFEEVREGRERLEALSRRLVETQEAERRAIARELHDEIGQLLTGLKLLVESAARTGSAWRASPAEITSVVNELMTRVRDLSMNLRPPMLDELGLVPALLWHFGRYTAQTRVHVAFQQRIARHRLPPDVQMAAFRIVQEALTNAARQLGGDLVVTAARGKGTRVAATLPLGGTRTARMRKNR